MKTLLFTVILLAGSLHIMAQQAPDFTITDSDGVEHTLYADYLDQGKTVMIKIFFTTCPPCNSIAPLMEPFYQEWGAGEFDVEFFELSDKNFDTDQLVNDYKALYNITFPSAGVEGNSLTAVQPYKSGMFGPWFGTPTFIVIAPDGTVNYDVGGGGNQQTINAIDAALTATGALKPGQLPPAPNFTTTDVEGLPHQLYSQYINQGKTIVLEIFNTTSSASNAIAPMVKELYEQWGGGDHDVEFIALTDRNADSNPLVFDFLIEHDLTFPGISKDGGSLAAVEIYKDGTYGPFVDVPTFVVIGANGAVQYDLRGATMQATIDSLNEAIIATGASLPPPPPTMAPDFMVTDVDGSVRRLYADYLNQGKSVLLEIFYTTCPPCNSIAPLMEPFYQEWGAGENDVEFFRMTDKNFDTDALVEAYRDQYDETFIAVSRDGGSLDAVQPYKNGSFGPWHGTPTYIVIAPDGTIQYDVDGPTNEATIAALDAALLATGAEKPSMGETPVMVTGHIKFLNSGPGVNNVIVQVVNAGGQVIIADTTNTTGNFQVPIFLSQVQADWEVRAVKTGTLTNGVNALDLVRIQKHVIFLEPFTNELFKLASDINGSGTISTLDIAGIVRVLLGITNQFPDNNNWLIFPADTQFGEPTNHPPVIPSLTIPLQDILDGVREAEFIAVKKGDANGNANPAQ